MWKNEVFESEFTKTTQSAFGAPKCQIIDVETDGENLQHVGVFNKFAAAVLRGEPLVADGREGINGLSISNAMHLSAWQGREVSLPLSAEDEGSSGTQSVGGSWGRQNDRSGSRFANSYGRSSRPVTERGPMGQRPVAPTAARPQLSAQPKPVSRPQQLPKRTPDADFEPTPILQLQAGDRIEHNRFGFGKIVEISGEITDLKARIQFDDHGEKILILKYAKIRKV
jgi:hypothetical protein